MIVRAHVSSFVIQWTYKKGITITWYLKRMSEPEKGATTFKATKAM